MSNLHFERFGSPCAFAALSHKYPSNLHFERFGSPCAFAALSHKYPSNLHGRTIVAGRHYASTTSFCVGLALELALYLPLGRGAGSGQYLCRDAADSVAAQTGSAAQFAGDSR